MRTIGALLFCLVSLQGQVIPWLQRELLGRSAEVLLARFDSESRVSAVVQISHFSVQKTFKGNVRDLVRVGDLGSAGKLAARTPVLLFLKKGSAGFVHSALELITLEEAQLLQATRLLEDQLRILESPPSATRDTLVQRAALENLNSPLGLARRAALHDLTSVLKTGRANFSCDDLLLLERAEAPRDLVELKRSLIDAVRSHVFGAAAEVLNAVPSAADRDRLTLALQRMREAPAPDSLLPVQLEACGTSQRFLLRMLLVDGKTALRMTALRTLANVWSSDPPAELLQLPAVLDDAELDLRVDVAGRIGGVSELSWLRERARDTRCRVQALTAVARLQLAEGSDFLRQEAAGAGDGEEGRQFRQLITHLLSDEFRKAETLRRSGARRY